MFAKSENLILTVFCEMSCLPRSFLNFVRVYCVYSRLIPICVNLRSSAVGVFARVHSWLDCGLVIEST